MPSRLFLLIFISLVITTSCSEDIPTYDVPEWYTFTRNGNSTVDFNGQTSRIQMGEELSKGLLDFSKSEADLISMFTNENNAFLSEELNLSNKNIKSKVAASIDYFNANTTRSAEIRNQFEEWIVLQVQEIAADSDKLASQGSSGQISDGGTVRYVGEKGLEYNQAVIKGLIGALMLDQIVNNYLSTAILDAGSNRTDNDQGITIEGKPYTNMEHKWDEAYGYLFGNSLDKTNPLTTLGKDDSFLNKYLGRVENDEDFTGIAEEIFSAFKRGRAAIVAGEYDDRNEQIAILRELLSEIIGIRAVYYLQQGKNALESGNLGTAFHDLSEGIGFIYSLQFTRIPMTERPYLEEGKVKSYIDQLLEGDGFWTVKSETLDQISEEIANEFNFSLEAAAQ